MEYLIYILMLAQAGIFIAMWRRGAMNRGLVTSLLIYWLMWLGVPVLLNIISWDLLLERVIPFDAYLVTASIELSSFFGGCSVVYVGTRFSGRKQDAGRFFAKLNTIDNALVWGAITLYVTNILFAMLEQSSQIMGYIEQNTIDSDNPYGKSSLLVLLGPVYISVLYAYVCLDQRATQRRGITSIVAWMIIIVDILLRIASGGRFVPLIPVFLLILMWSYNKDLVRQRVNALSNRVRRARRTLIISGLLCVTAVGVVVLPQLRVEGAVSMANIIEGSKQLEDTMVFFKSLMFHTRLRLDAIYYSGALVFNSSQPGDPYNVFRGAFYTLVPRFVWPEKPITGSFSGNEYDLPYRLAAKVLGMGDSGNVSMSPGAIAFWEFGPLGIAIHIALWVLFLVILNRLFAGRSFIYLICAVYLLSIPTFVTLYASPETTLVLIQRVVFMVLCYRTVDWVAKRMMSNDGVGARRGKTPARIV